MKWTFGLLFPLGQRLERDIKVTSPKQNYIKNMKTWEFIPYSGSIRTSFTCMTTLVSAPPGRTLGLLVCLTPTLRHLQGHRQIWQIIWQACRTYPCCMFLPEHTQCGIPLLCKPCDWPKVSPKGPLTSYLVSQLQTWHRAQSCHHPLCRLLGKPNSSMVMVKACRMGKVFKVVLGGDEL